MLLLVLQNQEISLKYESLVFVLNILFIFVFRFFFSRNKPIVSLIKCYKLHEKQCHLRFHLVLSVQYYVLYIQYLWSHIRFMIENNIVLHIIRYYFGDLYGSYINYRIVSSYYFQEKRISFYICSLMFWKNLIDFWSTPYLKAKKDQTIQEIIQEFNLGVPSHASITLWCELCSWGVGGGGGAVSPHPTILLYMTILLYILFCYIFYSFIL